jgi:hypothetical protein
MRQALSRNACRRTSLDIALKKILPADNAQATGLWLYSTPRHSDNRRRIPGVQTRCIERMKREAGALRIDAANPALPPQR